ncbi:MAG: hypothetical protein R3C39_14680 [Dehalococcoidia bacterium]
MPPTQHRGVAAPSRTVRAARAALVATLALLALLPLMARAQSAELVPNRFPTPPAGTLTWGVAGTSNLEALLAAQDFPVAAAFTFDAPTGTFLRFIPGAPAVVNTLRSLTPDTVVRLRRRDERPASVLDHAQVVSFYGAPGIPAMGALGTYDTPRAAGDAIQGFVADYRAAGDGRPVLGAFHIVAAIAQRSPGNDGTYLGRLSSDRITPYIEEARRRGFLVFLDVQVGWSEPVDELRRLAPYLEDPIVHVALDPEFATRPDNEPPGAAIGTLDADQINEAQAWLAQFVRDHDLPAKILIVHQFREDMLAQPEDIAHLPEIDLVIDMDGFGPSSAKLSKYDRFALSSYAEYSGLKLFFDHDTPLLTPADVQALKPPPNVVIYQ